MKNVGDIFYEDNFGAKAYYKVLKVNEDGTCVAQLQVGYIPPNTIEDMISEVKEKAEKAEKAERTEKTEKKRTATTVKKPTTTTKRK